MTTIKRFTPDYAMHAARFEPFAREAEHGEYVRFDAHQQEVSALEAERDALADRVERLSGMLTEFRVATKSAEERADALAVENAAIKAMNDCLSEELRGHESDGAFEGPNMHHLWWKAETPVTDAALAAIQAQGVEKFADRMLTLANDPTYSTASHRNDLRDAGAKAMDYAANLREAK